MFFFVVVVVVLEVVVFEVVVFGVVVVRVLVEIVVEVLVIVGMKIKKLKPCRREGGAAGRRVYNGCPPISGLNCFLPASLKNL